MIGLDDRVALFVHRNLSGEIVCANVVYRHLPIRCTIY